MSLKAIAEKFTHYCRTGEAHASFKADPKRLAVYFDHYRNNIDEALEKMYPLTRHILKKKKWKELVDAFVIKETSTSPLFWQMPEVLMQFVQKGDWDKKFKVPYLKDLMHFEWVEVEIQMMLDAPRDNCVKEGHILKDPLYFNPESQLLGYSYPVFEKKTLPRPMQKGNYFLLGYRHPEDGEVLFIALSPFFAKVVQLLQEKSLSGEDVLKSTAKLFKLDEAKVLSKGEAFLEDLLQQQAIYGFRKNPDLRN